MANKGGGNGKIQIRARNRDTGAHHTLILLRISNVQTGGLLESGRGMPHYPVKRRQLPIVRGEEDEREESRSYSLNHACGHRAPGRLDPKTHLRADPSLRLPQPQLQHPTLAMPIRRADGPENGAVFN